MNSLTFFKNWFKGFEKFLESSSQEVVESVLQHCAKACSECKSLEIYREAFKKYDSLEKALLFIKNSLDDFHYKILDSHIEVYYTWCDCDLYVTDLVTSPKLCLCSERSLLYNWESVYGQGKVTVERETSILEGDDLCRFIVKVSPLGHF